MIFKQKVLEELQAAMAATDAVFIDFHGLRIYRLASIGEGAYIGEGASIGERASMMKSPLYIIGTRHFLCQYSATEIKIGCIIHPVTVWLENFKAIGKEERYTPEEIEEYGKYIALAADLMGINTETTKETEEA